MIDADLAELYEVPTYRLNEQVQRNRKRFPNDFMFRLTKPEAFEIAICDLKDKPARFEVTICNLKDKRKTKQGRAALFALRIYGTGCRDVVECS